MAHNTCWWEAAVSILSFRAGLIAVLAIRKRDSHAFLQRPHLSSYREKVGRSKAHPRRSRADCPFGGRESSRNRGRPWRELRPLQPRESRKGVCAGTQSRNDPVSRTS